MGAHFAGNDGVGTCRAGNEGAIVVLATKKIACCAGNEGAIVVLGNNGVGTCCAGNEGAIVVLATKEIARCAGNEGQLSCWRQQRCELVLLVTRGWALVVLVTRG